MTTIARVLDTIAAAPDDETAIQWVRDYYADKDSRITRQHAKRLIELARMSETKQQP